MSKKLKALERDQKLPFDPISLDWSEEEKPYPHFLGFYREQLYYRDVKLVNVPKTEQIYSLVFRDDKNPRIQIVYSKPKSIEPWKPCPICQCQIEESHIIEAMNEFWVLCDCKLSSPTFPTKKELRSYWNNR